MTAALELAPRRAVMVVDDDAAIREVLEAVLQAEGYPVLVAADGAEALALLRTGVSPGLILLDLRMPGMDGRTFRELQAADPALAGIPVVVISGDKDGPKVAGRLGIDFIMKPIDLERLVGLAGRFCDAA